MQFLPIRLLEFERNNSFSFANNRVAEIANGELLLLLNNDVVFSEDVLGRMAAALEDETVGAGGIKQYPGKSLSTKRLNPYHIGVRFKWDHDHRFLRPYNVAPRAIDDLLSVQPASFPAITGSALICRRSDYLQLGGLCEAYEYGFEDIDFCSKIRFRLGKETISLNDVSLFHSESSTRQLEREDASRQRLKNIDVLKRRFGYLHRRDFKRQPIDDGSRTGKRFMIAFAVCSVDISNEGEDLIAAIGLGNALAKCANCDIRYLGKDDWHDAKDVDLYIAMGHEVDVGSLVNASPHLILIAWIRGSYDQWMRRPWLHRFNFFLASSGAGASYLEERCGIASEVFPAGVALELFNLGPPRPEYEVDCVAFANGCSSADASKDFDFSSLPCRFAIYGNPHDRGSAAPNNRRFLTYSELPLVYNSARLTIDGTASTAQQWGSVGSGVFQALAGGSLVLSNNAVGSQELFGGELPVWRNAQDLAGLINFYLTHPYQRDSLVTSLRDRVVADHSYERRASKLISLIETESRRIRIAIKFPARQSEAASCGDYHLANALAKALRAFEFAARVDVLEEWETPKSLADDVAIVLRGPVAYNPSSDQINICWLISHPDKVKDEELEQYDRVFIASAAYAEAIKSRRCEPAAVLLQGSDPHVFRAPTDAAVTEAEHPAAILAKAIKDLARLRMVPPVDEPLKFGE